MVDVYLGAESLHEEEQGEVVDALVVGCDFPSQTTSVVDFAA